MIGTASQIEWAAQIRSRVDAEFDRVANAFRSTASRQGQPDRDDTLAVIAILEEKRSEVMANDQAGYFIRDWQELTDQVRRMIAADGRYHAIKAKRKLRPVQ
jgi:cell division FtsZ-interacting protein ZapD